MPEDLGQQQVAAALQVVEQIRVVTQQAQVAALQGR